MIPKDCLLIISGSRDWVDPAPIRQVLSWYHPNRVMIFHGAARGADTIAAEEAKRMGFVPVPFPADWDRHGRAAGPIRNREMIAAAISLRLQGVLVEAAIFPLKHSIGSVDMYGLCNEYDIRVVTERYYKKMLGQ